MELGWALLWGLVIYGLLGFRIAKEYERGVILRLGRFTGIKGPGLYWIIPFIDQQSKIDNRTVTVDVESQEAITRDSVTVRVNAVLWYKIADPARAIISVANYRQAVYQVALTSLRNIIGQHDLDEILRARDKINETLRKIVDDATDPWGVDVEMLEMKDVEIPQGMQRVMAIEAEAMREKRARLIKAEAEQEASEKLCIASQMISANPVALELRRMQMMTEIGAEQNTTTVVMFPSDFMSLAHSATRLLDTNRVNASNAASLAQTILQPKASSEITEETVAEGSAKTDGSAERHLAETVSTGALRDDSESAPSAAVEAVRRQVSGSE